MDSKELTSLAAEIGLEVLQTENGRIIGTKSLVGLGAISAGTAIETISVGLGATGIGSVGYALTGVGCAAAQTAITAASTVPVVGGVLSSGIAGASSLAFAIASNPITLGLAAFAGGGYCVYRLLKKK